MNDITVLSTACGTMFMPGFFRCLKHNGERNIRIIGCDASDVLYMAAIVDVFYQVPKLNDPNYIPFILDICEKEKVDIVFPQISMELGLFRNNLLEFTKRGIKVACMEKDTLSIANNKCLLYSYMKENGLETPDFYIVKDSKNLKDAAAWLGYPKQDVCVKIAEGSGSRGVRILSAGKSKADIFLYEKPNSFFTSLEEMCGILDAIERKPDMFAMKALPGCEYTVDLLADKGNVICMVGRRNTTSSMSIAQTSVIERKQEAYDLCESIVKLLQLDGNIGFDFMLDERDCPVLTDLNPRVTATIILYMASGINFPYMRIKQLLGEKIKIDEVRYGKRLVRKYDDILLDENGTRINF